MFCTPPVDIDYLVTDFRVKAPMENHRQSLVGDNPLSFYGQVGTGGFNTLAYQGSRLGYRLFLVGEKSNASEEQNYGDKVVLIKEVFGRNGPRLAGILGVSRQTMYNWIDGVPPKQSHREKIDELADAADILKRRAIVLDALALDRVVSGGKSFAQILSEGGRSREAAEKLAVLLERGAKKRALLAELSSERVPLGRNAINEFALPSYLED